jgi:hypothetical protein
MNGLAKMKRRGYSIHGGQRMVDRAKAKASITDGNADRRALEECVKQVTGIADRPSRFQPIS